MQLSKGLRKLWGEIFKTSFNVSRGHFWAILFQKLHVLQLFWKNFVMTFVFDNFNSISFLYFHWELIGLLTRVFSQFRPNTLLRFHRNCLLKRFFEIHFVSYVFSNFQLKYLDFTHQIRTSLSTLLSNSLQEIINDYVFQERLIFFLFSDFDQKFFWLSTMSFLQGCQNSVLRC